LNKNPKILSYEDGKSIVVKFDNKVLKNVIYLQKLDCGGDFSRNAPIVFVDPRIPKKWRISTSLHETCEKYLKEKYDMDEEGEGHDLTEKIEKRWFSNHFIEKYEEYDNFLEKLVNGKGIEKK
jgi:hypothetical protein